VDRIVLVLPQELYSLRIVGGTAMPWTPLISRPRLLFRSPDHGLTVLEEAACQTSAGKVDFLCTPLDRNRLGLPRKLYSRVCQIIHPPRPTPCHACGS